MDGFTFVVLVLALAIYFLPAEIAHKRIIGWVGALVWSLTN